MNNRGKWFKVDEQQWGLIESVQSSLCRPRLESTSTALLEHGEMVLQSLEQLLRVAVFRVHLQCAERGGEDVWEHQVQERRGSSLNPGPNPCIYKHHPC